MNFGYKFTSHVFDNPGYLLCDIPDCVKDEIVDIMNNIDGNSNLDDARHALVGHIDREYFLPILPNIKYLVESMCAEYDRIFKYTPIHESFNFKTIKKYNYELKTLWINYSKKYDFNPIHTHTGSYSFVIWIKIPFELESEMKKYSLNSDKNRTSLFSFHYIDTLGSISHERLYIDKSWEWKMAFFPSKLNHSVNPFYTSDGYRVSISGNVYCFPEYEN